MLFAYMSVGFCLYQAVWAAVLVLCMSVSVWNMCSILLLEGQGDMDHNLKSVIVGGTTRFQNPLDSATPNTGYLQEEHSCQLEFHFCAAPSVLSQ